MTAIRSDAGRKTRLLTAIIYFLTLATFLVTSLVPGPDPGVSLALVLGVKLVPLLIFMPAVLRGSNRGYIWMSFVLLLYFMEASVSLWLSEGSWGPLATSILTLLLFVMTMWHLKANRYPA